MCRMRTQVERVVLVRIFDLLARFE
jgi:hypothetical protein